jgi:ATP-dependent RNA helicase RhlE
VTIPFQELPIIDTIQSALRSLNYVQPTPIQSGSMEPLLAGRDLLGCAQTGTGKTAAFTIPLLQLIHGVGLKPEPNHPVALILAPTRELVVQISENVKELGKHTRVRHTAIYGGVGQRPQVAALTRGVHILIATPGRLLDLVEQGHCSLAKIRHFVLDEADRMLDMGFMPDIQRIVRQLPREKQSVFLSATMPPPIESLAAGLLRNHVTVMVAPPATTAERVEQCVMFVKKDNKRKLLDLLLADKSRTRVLVFMRTKHGADRMYKSLQQAGVSVDGIHGGRSQNARQRVLTLFRNGDIRVLIATDVAARGIDIDNISHVINFEVPNESDSYVHRIGRTARAGAAGESVTLCDEEEYERFKQIEREIKQKIPVDREHPFHCVDVEDAELQSVLGEERRRAARKKVRSGSAIVTRTKKGAFADSQPSKKEWSPTDKKTKKGSQRKRSISGKIKKLKPKDAGNPGNRGFKKKVSKKKRR